MDEALNGLLIWTCIGLVASFNVGMAVWYHRRERVERPAPVAVAHRPPPMKPATEYHYDRVSVMPNAPSDPPRGSGSDPPAAA